MTNPEFDKYVRAGAYHWRQADPDRHNGEFNPPLPARYQAILRLVPAGAKLVLDVGCGDGFLIHFAA